jgi:hypothetical protein
MLIKYSIPPRRQREQGVGILRRKRQTAKNNLLVQSDDDAGFLDITENDRERKEAYFSIELRNRREG